VRRRPLVLAALALLGASIGALVVVVQLLAPRDKLTGIDVEAERVHGASPGAGASADAEAGQDTAPSGPPPLPTLAELAQLADGTALRAHVVALDTALEGAAAGAQGELHLLLSTAHRILGESALALEHADRALALEPASSVAHHTRARALAASLVDVWRERGWLAAFGAASLIGEFKGELAAAIALDPMNLDARDEEVALYLFAPWPIGGVEEARARIETIAELDPLRGVQWRAQALNEEDRPAEALALVDEYVAGLAPDTLRGMELARVCLQRGAFLQHLDRFVDAAAAYAPILAGPRTATWFQAAYEGAKSRQRGGFELEAAVSMLDEFIEANPVGDFIPPVAGAWYRKALCLRDLGRIEAARAALQRALELDPKFERAANELERLSAPAANGPR
jgi:tetratricopeptide (TPR) repeat protein